MNGDYDHHISKMVELAMAVGFVPMIEFKPAEEVFNEDYRFEITNTPSNRNDNVGDCNYMSPCISINDTGGTARGIFHAKTANTILNQFVLPPINLMNLDLQDMFIK